MSGVGVCGWRLCFGSCAGIRHIQGKKQIIFRTNSKLLLGSRRWREHHGEEGSLLQLSILASSARSKWGNVSSLKKKKSKIPLCCVEGFKRPFQIKTFCYLWPHKWCFMCNTKTFFMHLMKERQLLCHWACKNVPGKTFRTRVIFISGLL